MSNVINVSYSRSLSKNTPKALPHLLVIFDAFSRVANSEAQFEKTNHFLEPIAALIFCSFD